MHCTLCSETLPKQSLWTDDLPFCCIGCQTVHSVLRHRGQLENFREQALFRQAVQAGLISNPQLLQSLRQNSVGLEPEPPVRWHFAITDLWCPSCAEVIRLILLQERGVVQCVVDYFTDLACVEFYLRDISRERLFAVIAGLGYHPVTLESTEARRIGLALWLRFIIAAFAALNLMMFAYPIYATYFTDDPQHYATLFTWISLAVSVPVVTYSAWPFYRRAYSSLCVGVVGMEALVSIGVLSAFAYSVFELAQGGIRVYFDSMAVIVALVLLGKIIETRAKFSAKETLLRLAQALPRRGRKWQADGTETLVPLKEIQCGDELVALTGEKIVLDGQVIAGEGAVDESLLTGEAVPILKKNGMRVTAGTLLCQGRLRYRVVATPEQTLLKQIIAMVEQDLGKRSALVRRVDQIASWFVPVTLLLATGAGLWTGSLLRALAVLLISCPCAIGIAVPLAESYLMQGMARLGAIVRNRRCLESLGRETVFVFDKTGTITQGVFSVNAGLSGLTSDLLAVLKALTAHSVHPIAGAIQGAIPGPWPMLDETQEVAGKGLVGQYQGRRYLLGSQAFLAAYGILSDTCATAQTMVYFAQDQQLLAQISLGDQLRPQARQILAELAPRRCCLLSGDGAAAVEHVAQQCGFSEWYAARGPLEKRAFIEELVGRGEVVAMLGDGINDALALTAANIGISVISATDISVQVSDILLTTDRLTVVPQLCALAKRGRRIVKQNLFWAFAYNVVGLGLAAGGWLSPLFAAFAMAASSLVVLANSRRLRRGL
jgi:Cu2+-exporting ATPase